ncbi:glycosyltransferase [Escherichia coli]|nr:MULTISPECIES: glycosyltransferase family 2 protein [Enterobacteriaceae]EGF2694965.1 glycosyltransferase [Shigella sonnei]APK63774.1 protein rfbJ [Escherichia coli]APK66362.1 protein rfbJ [Escherichia coli]EES0913282.1 glycosyltransferase [Escherichia coli]EEW1995453.1 glycosyltransferase [Escherichia coli]
MYHSFNIAVIIPCYNEQKAIAKVINDFKTNIPTASIYVFDNNSTDSTAQVAEDAGATVHFVPLKGKGNVVRRMFSDVDADIYLMVDGDDTYDASSAPEMINHLIKNQLDMVVGCRQENGDQNTYRKGHRWGNKLLTGTVQTIFKGNFTDMLSGYRVFSRRYVKSFPCLSRGFEIETELTIHALELRMKYGEVNTKYGERPEGSVSKLSTWSDGFKILKTIIKLYSLERPLYFFSIIGVLLAALSIILGLPIIVDYIDTGLVRRFPTAFLTASIMLSSIMAFVCGIILHSNTTTRREMKALFYLSEKKL